MQLSIDASTLGFSVCGSLLGSLIAEEGKTFLASCTECSEILTIALFFFTFGGNNCPIRTGGQRNGWEAQWWTEILPASALI